MKEFLSSPQFTVAVMVATVVTTIAVILWRNIRWVPRGITPRGQVPGGVQSSLRLGWKFYTTLAAAILLALLVGWWFWSPSSPPEQSPAPSTPFWHSPSLETVWNMTQTLWFWIVIILIAAYIASNFFQKEKAVANAIKAGAIVVGTFLFIVVPILVVATSTNDKGSVSRSTITPAVIRSAVMPPSVTMDAALWPRGVVPANGVTYIPLPPTEDHIVVRGIGPGAIALEDVCGNGQILPSGADQKCPDGDVVGNNIRAGEGKRYMYAFFHAK